MGDNCGKMSQQVFSVVFKTYVGVYVFVLPTSSILIRMSRPLPFSCSDFERMQSTRLSSSLQDMVWILLGRDSSSMFLAKSCTARDRSVSGKF